MMIPEWVYTIDLLFVVFVLLFVFSGLRNGLSSELAHTLTLTGLLAGFCFFYPQIVQFAADYWQALPPKAVQIAVPVVMLLAAILFFVLVRALLKQLLKSQVSGASDRLLGGFAGALRGTVTGLAVMAALSLIPNETLYRKLSETSSIGAWVCNTLTPWVHPRILELPVFQQQKTPSEPVKTMR